MADHFTCAVCRRRFKKEWSDREAEEEFALLFPAMDPADTRPLCGNCFNNFMAWLSTEGQE